MTDTLRQRAEDLLDTNTDATPEVPTADVQKLVHELQVHQVELEMQNEELQRGQIELAETRDAYVELYDFAPVGYLTLNAEGVILEGNLAAAHLVGVNRGGLVQRKFGEFVDPGGQDPWFLYFRRIRGSDEKNSVALELRRADKRSFTAQLITRPTPGSSPDRWRCMMAVIDISARKEAEDTLRRAHDDLERLVAQRTGQLRRLTSALSLAEEQERRRIAGELHDELGQMLATCRIRVDLLRESPLPEAATEHADSLAAVLDRVIDATRTLTFELSSPMLDQIGLGPALEQLCLDMRRDLPVRYTSKGELQIPALSDERRLVLYRCARELLVNVIRHAEAGQAGVTLEGSDSCVRIQVEDDGRGFDASDAGKGFSATGGFGLFNTRESIRHAGGELRIESVPGEGTRVTLEIPLEVL